MPDNSPSIILKEKLIEVISEAGHEQMQREPTRGQNLLILFCCNKPSPVKDCISITNSLDSGDIVIGVFLDNNKTFDTVDHTILF